MTSYQTSSNYHENNVYPEYDNLDINQDFSRVPTQNHNHRPRCREVSIIGRKYQKLATEEECNPIIAQNEMEYTEDPITPRRRGIRQSSNK